VVLRIRSVFVIASTTGIKCDDVSSFFSRLIVSWKQGDQIFAYWAIVNFGRGDGLKIAEVAQIFGPLFSTVPAMY
jgi:hypothetical protein